MSMDTYDEDLISLISMGIYECEWGTVYMMRV